MFFQHLSNTNRLSPVLLAATLTLLSGCVSPDYTPMSFTVEQDRLVARGVIDASTPEAFREAVATSPEIRILELRDVGGSADDDANLELGRSVREAGFATIVPSTGMVASGGTDLFLAGTTRTLESGACVGVHSWGSDIERGDQIPREAEVHTLYTDYFREMGTPEAFYWFTLYAATPEDIHWMTQREVNRYRMTSAGAPALSGGEVCDLRGE